MTDTSEMKRAGDKPYKGVAMEGFIAKWYAKNTKKNIEQYRRWADQVKANLADGSKVLEVASGPGYLSVELAKLGNYKIVGLDISNTNVEIAQKNARETGVVIEFRQGDAGNMPFNDESFDFIICTAAFKNFTQPVKVLDEMFRVLASNGSALIIDLRRDASKESIDSEVRNMGLSRVDSLLTKWTFKHMLMKIAYTKNEINELVPKTRFGKCEIHETPIALEILLKR
jgi:ubiquinone/menaquinone biosynthesis C-methylase UbiE